ncbi:MAG: AgmX/PglI C-terminal domain-containing protein [Enhygromyxa sp.]
MARLETCLALVIAVASVGCRTSQTQSEIAGPWDKSPPAGEERSDQSEALGSEINSPALTRDEIRMVVRAKLPQIRSCFEAGLASDPQLRGRVLLRFEIGPEGKAAKVEVEEDQLGQDSVTACLLEQLRSWQFPRPRDGRSIVILYPFSFSSEQSLRALGLPRVEGTVKPEAVGAVFEARQSELDACVPAGASGSIGVALTVDDRGQVTRVSSYQDSLPEGAGPCVLRTVSTWVFPPAAADDEARINHDLRW